MKTLSKITLFLIIAKGFGFAKELLLVSRFGFSEELDEYNLVIITSLATAGFLVSIINNYFIDYFKDSSTEGLFQIVKKILYFSPILPSIYIVVMIYFTKLSLALIILGSVIILIYSFSAILAAFIMAKKMILNSYLEFVPAFLLVIGIYLFEEITTYQLVIIFIGGVTVQGVLYLHFVRKNRFSGKLNISISLGSISTIVLAQFIVLIVPFIDSFVVIENGQGELAGFSFAQRLIGTVMAMITVISTRYILPLLSSNSSDTELINFSKMARRIFFGLILLVIVAEILLSSFGMPAVLVKYFAVLLLYIPFYSFNIIMLNAHVARGNYMILFVTSVIGISVKVLVYVVSLFSDFLWVPWSLVAMSIISALYINSRKIQKNVS